MRDTLLHPPQQKERRQASERHWLSARSGGIGARSPADSKRRKRVLLTIAVFWTLVTIALPVASSTAGGPAGYVTPVALFITLAAWRAYRGADIAGTPTAPGGWYGGGGF